MDVLYDMLKAQEYWRLMDLSVDLVIVSEEAYSYALPLFTLISDIVLSGQTHVLTEIPKDIFLLDGNKVTPEDMSSITFSANPFTVFTFSRALSLMALKSLRA